MAELRESNFQNDIKIGKIGEEDLIKILANSPKTEHIEDASNDPLFQLLDIDVIQFTQLKKDGTQYTINDVKEAFLTHSTKRDFFNAYEVKTDTRAEETRNVPYEMISHDNTGCCAITRADYVYFVFLDNATREIKERWLITTKDWRQLIREHFNETYVKLHNFNRTNDKVLNFLCNIEEMEKQNVAKKVNPRG